MSELSTSASSPSASRTRGRPTPSASAFPPIIISAVTPAVDGGRFAVKRLVGDTVVVTANAFKDGHDKLRARVRYRGPRSAAGESAEWRTTPMQYNDATDAWTGAFTVDAIGTWSFTVEAWTDTFETWRSGLGKKYEAGQDVSVELIEGSRMIDAAARRTRFGAGRRALESAARALGDATADMRLRVVAALAPDIRAAMAEYAPPSDLTAHARELPLLVERREAGFAAWYEFFPRSATGDPTCARHFPAGRRHAAAHRRARLRRRLPAADPPNWDYVP